MRGPGDDPWRGEGNNPLRCRKLDLGTFGPFLRVCRQMD